MFNCSLQVALETIYVAKDAVILADGKMALREEGDRAGCGFHCGIELVVVD